MHFRSGKAKELMALCVYRDGRPVSIHEIVENLWGENADGTGYRRTIKELADTAGLWRGGDVPAQPGEPAGADGPGGLGFSGIHERR